MPKSHATILLRRRCKYDKIEFECPGGKGEIPRDHDTAIHTGGAEYDITIRVKDDKNRQIKNVKFHTKCADHWAAHDHGVVLEAMGNESDQAHPRRRKKRIGETHTWQEDKEAFYAEQDRKEAEKQKAEKEEARKKAEQEEARKKAEQEAQKKAEEEARKKEDARKKAVEEARKNAEVAKKKAEEEARKKAEQDAKKKAEQEARKKAEEEAKKKAVEEAKKKAEEEARKKEEAKKKAEEEAKKKAEQEEARKKAEQEAQKKAEEEARKKEETRKKAEEEAKKKAVEEARKNAEVAKKKAEEEARKKAEQDTKKKAEQEARKKAEEEDKKKAVEEAKKKAEEEARKKEEAKKKAEEETKKKSEEEAKKKAEEEAKKKAVEEAKKKAEEEARKKEEAKKKAEEEAKKKAEEEAKKKAEEEAKKKAEEEAKKKAEEETRKKEETKKKAEEEEARKAAEDRKIKREEAKHLNDVAEKNAREADIRKKMEEKRLNAELMTEQTINFENSTSQSAVKQKIFERQQESDTIMALCEILINGSECQKRYETLKQAFATLKSGTSYYSYIMDAISKFFANTKDLKDENLTRIILENINDLPKSLTDVLLGKLLCCSVEDVKSKTEIFDLMVAVFEQRCSEESIWHKIKIKSKESHEFVKHCDATEKSKCLNCFEIFLLLKSQVTNIKETSPDEMLNTLKLIQKENENYPDRCVVASLNAFADVCNTKKIPDESYEFIKKILEEDDTLLPLNILDFVAQNISSDDHNTAKEFILKSCFNKGQMSKGTLEYLVKVCNKQVKSTYTNPELLQWIGEYVQNFNQIPNGFFSYVVSLVNSYTFPSIIEFKYCICILEFYLTHFNVATTRDELKKNGESMFLKFLTSANNNKNADLDNDAKVALLQLMTRLLFVDRIETNPELSKTLMNIVTKVENDNEKLSQAAFEYLKLEIIKNVKLFEWIIVPESILTVNNQKLKNMYILLTSERLESEAYVVPQETLLSIGELLKTGNCDEDAIAACLTTIAIEISKEKSRAAIKEIETPEIFEEIFHQYDNKHIKTEAIFAISEWAMACSEHREKCFPLLKQVFFIWPTVMARAHASKALTKIISELPKENVDLLKDFLNQDLRNELLYSPTQNDDTKTVLLAWLGHFKDKIPDQDFKQLCEFSDNASDKTIFQIIFGLALQNELEPKDKTIQQLRLLMAGSDYSMPVETIAGIKHFIEQETTSLDSKIQLAEMFLNYCKKSAKPSSEIMEALNALNTTEDAKLCDMYVEATSYYVSNAPLPQSAIKHLWDKIVDSSASIPIRKTAARTILLAILQRDGSLEEKYMSKLACLLDTTELIVPVLLILCSVNMSQLIPVSAQLTEKLLSIQKPDPKKIVGSSDTLQREQDLCFRLAQIVSKKLKDNKNILFFSELNSNCSKEGFLHCNWMSEWIKLYPADEQQVFRLVNSTANKLMRTTTTASDGNQLKQQVLISRAENARIKAHYSKAISWLDKASQNAKKYSIDQFDKELLLQRAIVHQLFGSHNAAIKELKKLKSTEEGATSFWLQYSISRSLLASGRYEAALKSIKSLPTNVEDEFLLEITLREKITMLSKNLSEKTGSKAIAKAQLKFLLTKTLNNETKQVCTLIEFLLERGEHYDLSVLATKPETEWELEFLKSEIYGRLKDAVGQYPEVANSYKKLKIFLQSNDHDAGSDMWKTKLYSLLKAIVACQTKSIIVSANTCIDTFLLLRLKDDSGQKILSSCKSDIELIASLQLEWLKEECNNNDNTQQPSEKDLQECWEAIRKGPMQNKSMAFLQTFLQSAMKSSKFQEIVSFLKFCQSHDVKEQEINAMVSEAVLGIQTKDMNLKEKQKQLERKLLSDKVHEVFENEDKLDKLQFYLLGLFDRNVSTSDDIMKLLKYVNNDNKKAIAQALLETLYIFTTYQLEFKPETAKEVLNVVWNSNDTNEWKSKAKDALNSSFKSGDREDKSTDQLISEFQENNKDCSKEVKDTITKLGNLVKQINDYKSCTLKDLSTHNLYDWKKEDLFKWANKVKEEANILKSNEYMVELLAIMQKAVYIAKGYRLRDVSLMSVILLLSSKTEGDSIANGCLAKIATGEGKSAIVATLAAIKVLQGKKVDIVTSSPVLAERDAKEWNEFYENLGLSAEDNGGQQEDEDQPKSCYTKDVVYGDASMFEGDVLRHEFSLLGTRGHRTYDVVIVDEVDSMFIDGSNHSTRLIQSMPEMEYLENVFALIWYEIQASGCLEINDKIFLIDDSKGDKTKEGLYQALAMVLPDKCKAECNVYHESSLATNTQTFAESMLQMQLNDQNYKKYITNLLQDKKILAQFETELQASQTQSDEGGIVVDFIKSQWKLDKESDVRRVLEKFLDMDIFIYEAKDKEMDFSKMFHSYDYTGNAETKREEIHFFISGDRLYYLKPVENMQKGIAERTANNVSKIVKKSDNKDSPKESNNAIIIPSHLYDMFLTKIDEWIQSALQAKFVLEEDRDYVVKDKDGFKTIVPVDFQNTGVTEESCVWGQGLHQFLQMKHKFRITPEYLATNYLSNLTFFKNYPTIFGLTGTLGDESERQLLKDLYQVTTLNVPTFITKQLLELAPIVALENKAWLSNILYSTTLEVRNKRAVLIICKTIDDVGIVHKHLEDNIKTDDATLKIYSRSDDITEAKIMEDKFEPGTVIVATNLAGRGTNIKLNEKVVENGGLHVIISFLPTNLRVEEQAAGRAARCGEPGTFMLIINAMTDIQSYTDESSFQIGNIKEFRKKNESDRVMDIRNKLVKEIEKEKELFTQFCNLRSTLKSPDKIISQNILNGIAERWAIQLETVKTKGKINWESISDEFNTFFTDLKEKQKADNAVTNPTYYILEGNQLCVDGKYGEAIGFYEKAIELDAYFVHNAYYYMAYAMINNGRNNEASGQLNKAFTLIAEIAIPSLMQLHSMIETKTLDHESSSDENANPYLKKSADDSDITKQIIGKINFFYLQLKSIQDATKQLQSGKQVVAIPCSSVGDYYAENKQEFNDADLTDMYNDGFVKFFRVEKKPVPWYKFAVVFILGAIQLVAGIALTVCGLPNIGSCLICEGIGDIVMGISAVISGELDLREYLKCKAKNFAVDLLCAGVGAAFKAVAKISTTVQTVVKQVKGVLTSIKTFAGNVVSAVKNSAKHVWSWVAKGARHVSNKFFESSVGNICKRAYDWTKEAVETAYSKVMDSKFMQSCKQWRDDALDKMRTKTDKTMTKSKEFLGYDKISPENQKQLKSVGKQILDESFAQGVLPALTDAFAEPIDRKIKEKIKATVTESLQFELRSGTDLYKQITEVLTSSTNAQAEIDASMRNYFVGYKSELGYRFSNFAEKIGGELKDATDEYINNNGGLAIIKFIETVAANAIINTVLNAKTISELKDFSSELIKHLKSLLDKMPKNPADKSESAAGNEVQNIVNEYIENWSEEIADEVTQFVMNEYARPTIEVGFEEMYRNFPKLRKANEENMSGKYTIPGYDMDAQSKAFGSLDFDTDIVSAAQEVKPAVLALGKIVQAIGDNKDPMQNSQDMQMIAYSSMLQKPIQVFQVSEDGDFCYQNSFWENLSTSAVQPIRLLQLPTASGSGAKFVPMVNNDDGVLEVLELTDLPDECSLTTSVLIADGTQNVNRKSIEALHCNMMREISCDVPRFPNSVKVDFNTFDNITKGIILCNTA